MKLASIRKGRTLLVSAICLTLAGAIVPAQAYQAAKDQLGRPHETSVSLSGAKATVAFSPEGQGQALVVHAIQEAKREIVVQAYGFTNKAILKVSPPQ